MKNSSGAERGSKLINKKSVLLALVSLLLFLGFVWPTPWTFEDEVSNRKGGLTLLHLRINRFTGVRQAKGTNGKWYDYAETFQE